MILNLRSAKAEDKIIIDIDVCPGCGFILAPLNNNKTIFYCCQCRTPYALHIDKSKQFTHNLLQ
jgi:hypothetical protein